MGWFPNNVFEVEIGANKLVAALKKSIKEEKQPAFDHITTDPLVLWKVYIPHDPNFEQTVNETKFDDNNALRPLLKLFTIFLVQPEEGNVHIVVDPAPL
ncbi:hypothetical protein L208DRAFT_1324552 [Tricholoma matsutake]|nr:hypothetical protein L208DRAFT_1324552 [Tricholoma matsutake 945]